VNGQQWVRVPRQLLRVIEVTLSSCEPILVRNGDFPDDDRTSDHRPIELRLRRPKSPKKKQTGAGPMSMDHSTAIGRMIFFHILTG
jgi:hypothetical protein